MVAQLYRYVTGMGVLVLVIVACQPQAAPESALDSGLALTLTSAAQTISAQESLLAPQPIVAESTSTLGSPDIVSSATNAIATATEPPPTASFTAIIFPTDPPTITNTPSPSVPIAHITTNANCRKGPGRAYDVVTVVEVGQVHVVIGRYSNTYLIIQPEGAGACWLDAAFATTEGNVLALAESSPPATPTPQVGWIEGTAKVKNLEKKIITIAGIDVIVTPGNIRTETLGNGYYIITNVPVGEVTIKFEHPNYSIPIIANVVVRAGRPTTAPLVVGEPYIPHLLPTPCRNRFGVPCQDYFEQPSEVFTE